MAVSATNLTQGPGTLYHGAVGAVEPLDTAIGDAPDDAVWTDVGGTRDGISLTIAQEYSELEVDQIVDVPGRRLTKRDMSLVTNLAEPTLDNLALTLNAGLVTSGSGFKSYEPSADTSATQPNYCALLMDGFAAGGLRRRVIVRKGLSTNNVEFAYKKDEQTVFSVTFSAHYVSPSVKPFKIVDEAA
ncbi:hypothetical protein GCM10017691_23850 [Pseudonocardia petroleophila]|uniref:Phage major tail protein, phi13 family n=1 Tax=Pseudonocardia petroleophila TaxID=37331 RepID=A0A7G7MFV8_9PSEU|nr:hypothetical protein [Pseudonocardia petroleophila]QNG51669.1 hypothetical protein H6H00_26775 [Pseudonocardia petroleophila]